MLVIVSQLKENIKQDHSSINPQHFLDNPCWNCLQPILSVLSCRVVVVGGAVQVVGLAAPHTATRISAPGPAWRPALAQPNLTFRPGHTSRGPTFSWQRSFAVIFTIFEHSQWSMMIFADQCPNFR